MHNSFIFTPEFPFNESILRFVFNDFKNSYEKLLKEINQPSLRARRINDMLILVFFSIK